MSKKDHAILDLGDEDELQFTENDYKDSNLGTNDMMNFPDSPSHASGDMDTDRLLESEDQPRFNANFWTLAFYQQFFDVDTNDVKNRLIYSMVPIPGKSFLQHYIRPKPDLYGPIWICLTLVFSIAIMGNLSDYLSTVPGEDGDGKVWHYNFHKVTLAATAVFSYASLLPACLYGFLWYVGSGAGAASVSFLELLCLYGYSLAIYVPVSVLWMIQIYWLQWLLVLAGAGLSGAVLMMTVWPVVRDQATKSSAIVMIFILALHLLLACGFMLYFFHHGGPAAESHTIKPAPHNDSLTMEKLVQPPSITTENPNPESENNNENVVVEGDTKENPEVGKEVSGGVESDIKTDKQESAKISIDQKSVESDISDSKEKPNEMNQDASGKTVIASESKVTEE